MTNSFMIILESGLVLESFIICYFWKIAKWTSAKNEWHSIFLIFLVGSSLSVLVTLQTGNIHHVTMAMAILVTFYLKKK